ncbi:MAG: chromate transporter, partial [Elusimicrobia bacterium]|nr:chromate transporter [Elusimicrobiota bacterium]
MDEDLERLRAQARRLDHMGHLARRSAATPDGLRAAASYWRQARELYRRGGEAGKAAELEARLGRLVSRLVGLPGRLARANASGLEAALEPDLPRTEVWSRGRNGRAFRAWHSFLTIGCFGFGGPMAVWSLLHNEMVKRHKVLSNRDFLEAAVLGDILPGPVTMDIVTYT